MDMRYKTVMVIAVLFVMQSYALNIPTSPELSELVEDDAFEAGARSTNGMLAIPDNSQQAVLDNQSNNGANDNDGDGMADDIDPDDDNDCIPDSWDANLTDFDDDGINDHEDVDDDGDGLNDSDEVSDNNSMTNIYDADNDGYHDCSSFGMLLFNMLDVEVVPSMNGGTVAQWDALVTINASSLEIGETYAISWWLWDTDCDSCGNSSTANSFTATDTNYVMQYPWYDMENSTYYMEAELWYANGSSTNHFHLSSANTTFTVGQTGGNNSGGNNSSTIGDAHCLTLDNLTISSTYYVSIDLVNICNTSINYPGINASADHSGVSGFYNQTNWWYVIGANDSYTLNAQLAFDSLIQDGTNITLNFNTWILNCATNNSWHDCPNSSDFGNMSLQFTYANTTTNTNICGTDPSLTDLFVSIDNSDWTSIPSIVEGNYYVNCTVIGTHYWLEATIWSGSVNTSYFSTSWQEDDTYESISEDWFNLSAGTHCVNVTLWDITGGSQNYVDNEYQCFTLASSGGNNTGGNNTGGNTSNEGNNTTECTPWNNVECNDEFGCKYGDRIPILAIDEATGEVMLDSDGNQIEVWGCSENSSGEGEGEASEIPSIGVLGTIAAISIGFVIISRKRD